MGHFFGSDSSEHSKTFGGMKPCGHQHVSAEEALACKPHAWQLSERMDNGVTVVTATWIASRVTTRAKVEPPPSGPRICSCKGDYPRCGICGGTGIVNAASEGARRAALERLTVDDDRIAEGRRLAESYDAQADSDRWATLHTVNYGVTRCEPAAPSGIVERAAAPSKQLTDDDAIAAYERARDGVEPIDIKGRKVKPKPDPARVLEELRRAA